MRVIALSFLAALAAASSTNNAFNNPSGGYSFKAGEATTLTWDHLTSGTISLRLQSGSVTTSTSGTAIASHIDNTGTFTWKVPADLVKGREYTIEIIDDTDSTDYNFLPYFTVAGATGAASTPAPTTSSESTTTTAEATTTSAEATTTTSEKKTTTTAATTSTTAEKTTATTLTKATSTSATTSSSTPSTTATSNSTSTSSSDSDATSTSASASASASSSDVPNSNSGMINRVSGGMLALVAGVIAMM